MPQPLNILHVTANLGGGGVERLLVKSLPEFREADFNHFVCCVSAGGVYEVDLQRLGIPYWIMKRRMRFDPTVIFQMVHLMRNLHIDVMHALNFTANAWGRVAAKIAGVPRIIAHERGTAWTENALMRWIDRRLYPFTDIVLANSHAANIILTQHIHVPTERIKIIYNGVTTTPSAIERGTLRERLSLEPNIPLIGTVGRLDTPKGLPFLVQTIPLILQRRPETHFAIIGDGPLQGYLQKALADYRNVHLLGFQEDAPALMSDLDILLHPAIRESLGNVLIEAGLAEVPVVATNVDGIPEVIVNDKTGFLVPATEPVSPIVVRGVSPVPTFVVDGLTHQLRKPLGPAPEALANAVINLLDAPEYRHELGKQARKHTQERFKLERYVREVSEVYRGTKCQ